LRISIRLSCYGEINLNWQDRVEGYWFLVEVMQVFNNSQQRKTLCQGFSITMWTAAASWSVPDNAAPAAGLAAGASE
jgi:hypothetical protein